MNQMGKTKNVMAGITSTALLLGLAGCGGTIQQQMSDEEWSSYTKSNQSTSPAPSSSYSYDSSSSGSYTDDDIPPAPNDQSCTQWEWDLDDGVWECEDSTSTYYGHFYHGGKYYRSKPDLYNSTDYINYKKSSSFKGGKGTTINTSPSNSTTSSSGTHSSSVKGSSGFGSGSNSFGG